MLILCNSSDRIAKRQRTEARKQRLRQVMQFITWPLRLRIKVFSVPIKPKGERAPNNSSPGHKPPEHR